jgi:hypothetical protein
MMAWNQGKPAETLMSSSIREDKLAGDQLASPTVALRGHHIGGVCAPRVCQERRIGMEGKLA